MAMDEAPHFKIKQREGNSLEAIAREMAGDALESGHPDHYITLFARATQVIAMHRIPAAHYWGPDFKLVPPASHGS